VGYFNFERVKVLIFKLFGRFLMHRVELKEALSMFCWVSWFMNLRLMLYFLAICSTLAFSLSCPPSTTTFIFQPPILRFGFNFNKFNKKAGMIKIKDTLFSVQKNCVIMLYAL
jgi:hypothetical protein